ncbi:DNA-binding transcriptional regulator, FadR family [Eubacterium ruminantium]|uniref:DNA-binding transcriptional regulator, FadR family n=1 Tax=Eubacterium ruminantium TaxID=42322 RepID=A0A1T4LAN0_9FIRM|nr:MULTISPECIES: GntR family transcriptional regulator [Eubacterium]MCR5368254.1 GntR family transcriptional regulator [Eubacterium sp.]SCW44528.1 DNA-binding transcriptional regulator, FadR family [Eubacterium ruminantium]SDM76474.1 transcriptional regulator, GntR family [Eubacterium ruminantium]SJZ51651.1 DNA-binding transcriptional regulator, FadR family [Eubacterium ruminantium]
MTQNINLSQKTAEILKKRIFDEKTLVPGDKLPNENELSSELGVSRATLREAIRILVNDGVLTVYRGKGTFVSSKVDQFAEASVIGNIDNIDMKVRLRDLYEARLIIEPEAASLAAMRATEEEIEEILNLGEIVQKNIKKNPRGAARVNSEKEFHGAIMKAAHNDFLAQFIPVLTETIEKTFALDENLEIIAEDAYKDHIMIMHFLKVRDAAALKSAVTIHLHHAAINENLKLDI